MRGGDITAARAMIPYSLHDMADDGRGLLTALDMGHDRPRELWADLCDGIEAHARR